MGLICNRGVILELFTALPTSCAADQSQSYSSAGRSSGCPVRGLGGDSGVFVCGKGPKFGKEFTREMEIVRVKNVRVMGVGEWGGGGAGSDYITYASGREE